MKTLLEYLQSLSETSINNILLPISVPLRQNFDTYGLMREWQKYGLLAFQNLTEEQQEALLANYCSIYSPAG